MDFELDQDEELQRQIQNMIKPPSVDLLSGDKLAADLPVSPQMIPEEELLNRYMSAVQGSPEIQSEQRKRDLVKTLFNSTPNQINISGLKVGTPPEQAEVMNKSWADWAKAPSLEQEKKANQLKNMLDLYEKVENNKTNRAYRKMLGDKHDAEMDMTNAKRKDFEDSNNPLSEKSKNELKNSISTIRSRSGMLSGLASKSPGRLPHYQTAAEELQQIESELPNMSFNQQKEAQERARQIVADAQGFTRGDQGQQKIDYTEDWRAKQAALAAEKLANTKHKLEVGIKNAKLDSQTKKALDEISTNHTVMSRIDAIQNKIKGNPDQVGLMKKIELGLTQKFGEQDPEIAKLISDLAFIYQPYRKKNFGVPSAGDGPIVSQYFPDLKNNPKAFINQLQSFKEDNNYELHNKLGDFVASHTSDLGVEPGDITRENAYNLFDAIKQNVSRATKGKQTEKIDTQGMQSQNPLQYGQTQSAAAPISADIIKLAKEALADPNAPSAVKEQAKKKLDAAGVKY